MKKEKQAQPCRIEGTRHNLDPTGQFQIAKYFKPNCKFGLAGGAPKDFLQMYLLAKWHLFTKPLIIILKVLPF